MKKITVWALMAVLVVVGSAFAAPAKVVANATYSAGSPATTNNDDSCDISVMPAATLLLPYFEVNLDDPLDETTLFTITNVSHVEQIAHVTLWTDYSFPVIDFNIYLTGYDVQAINLYDVIKRGVIAPDAGTGYDPRSSTGHSYGDFSDANPAIADAILGCVDLPGQLPSAYATRMQNAFTLGSVPALGGEPACVNIGQVHANAVGYVTIDVADECSTSLPTDAEYYSDEIRFDNVFIGDYQQVNSNNNFAQGNPMVHIRAIPEGGEPDATPVIGSVGTNGGPNAVNFPRTFYSRYLPAGSKIDRRQPLPSVFAARWINGGATDFETYFKIWREGDVTPALTCGSTASASGYDDNYTSATELVAFDEEENAVGASPGLIVSPPITLEFAFPETSLTSVADSDFFPQIDAVAGWMYLNLDNVSGDVVGTPPVRVASQNWVITSMRADGRYSVDFDAAALANGCTVEAAISEIDDNNGPILGPAVAATALDQTVNKAP